MMISYRLREVVESGRRSTLLTQASILKVAFGIKFVTRIVDPGLRDQASAPTIHGNERFGGKLVELTEN
jgi:hypothetical protein